MQRRLGLESEGLGDSSKRMKRNENVMLRWMYGVTLRDNIPTVKLRRRLGIEGVVIARRGR